MDKARAQRITLAAGYLQNHALYRKAERRAVRTGLGIFATLLLGFSYTTLVYSYWLAIPTVLCALMLRPFVADALDFERSDLFVLGEVMLLIIARRLAANSNPCFGFTDTSDPKRRKFQMMVLHGSVPNSGLKKDLMESISHAVYNDLENLVRNGDPESTDDMLKLFDSESEELFLHRIVATKDKFVLHLEAGAKR